MSTLLERLKAGQGAAGASAPAPAPREEEPPKPPSEIEYLRPSSVRSYLKCPRRFWYEYIRKHRTVSGASAVAGTGMHRAAEVLFGRKIQTGEDPTPDEAAEIAADEVRRIVGADDVNFEEALPTADAVVDRSVLLARHWATDIAPEIKPKAVEVRFRTEIGGIPVGGTIDLVEHDEHLSDYKTTSRAPNVSDVEGNPQGGIYLAAREAMGAPNIGMSYRYLVFRKPTKARPEAGIESKRIALVGPTAGSSVRLAVSTVQEVAQAINAGAFPRNREGWHCSDKACPFFVRCMSGKDRP